MQRLVQANQVLADRREFQNVMNLRSSEGPAFGMGRGPWHMQLIAFSLGSLLCPGIAASVPRPASPRPQLTALPRGCGLTDASQLGERALACTAQRVR